VIVSLLMSVLADLVLNSAGTLRRLFDSEMSRYLDQRGFRPAPPRQAPTR
jgi:hypothetical protein